LRSVVLVVKLLIDVALCLLRLSNPEALYKQTFDNLMHTNCILYTVLPYVLSHISRSPLLETMRQKGSKLGYFWTI